MKAVMFPAYGSPDVLEYREDISKPIPADHEVLVEVHAACINSWDWELLSGKPFANRVMFGLSRPRKINILGCDIAGRVTQVGSNASKFQPGDEVFGDLSAGRWGGFAEFACADEDELLIKPKNISFAQAAATPQAGLLALQGLYDKGHMTEAEKVLINGSGGGVGTFAIQLAKLSGAEVTGVDSSEKLPLMRALGADHVVDYTKEDFTKRPQQYDLILDMVGSRSIFSYQQVLKPAGRYVMVGGNSTLVLQLMFFGRWFAMTRKQKMGLLLHKANKGQERLAKLIETGKISPVIDRCYPLKQTADALRYFGTGRTQGKIIIAVNDTDGECS